jgi:cytochrome d ubiquinol oxidase subunit II
VLAVASAAYLAAVFLAADAVRAGDRELVARFRTRALSAGVLAGAIAGAGLVVLHLDAHPLYHRLFHGGALAVLILSTLAGLTTLELVRRSLFEAARYTAALAVAGVIASWAIAQNPVLLQGLTVRQAAAPHDTLIAVIVAVIVGGVILFPSLALLFRLLLRGQLDHGAERAQPSLTGVRLLSVSASGLLARAAGASLLAGFVLLTLAEAPWAHTIGVLALAAFIVLGFLAVVPSQLEDYGSV